MVEYKGFRYQAESWMMPRTVVAKVKHQPGELFPRVGFIVTYLTFASGRLFSAEGMGAEEFRTNLSKNEVVGCFGLPGGNCPAC